MKRKFLLVLIVAVLFTLTGCKSTEKKEYLNKIFKEEYEDINGKENKSGKKHRIVTISEDNRFIEVTPKEIVKMIKNEETFYVYFGSRLCPWCRSVIEKADEITRLNDIEKVYYVDIWDDDGEEIFRDKYELDENNEPIKVYDGTEEYRYLLEAFDELLRDYSLTDSNGSNIPVGEKRIYAPNFVYIVNGVPKKLITGKSTLQKDSREELTDEMKKEEEEAFEEFFKNSCDDAC